MMMVMEIVIGLNGRVLNMNRVLLYQNLISMLEELDTEKNDSETLREVLDYIADMLKQFIDDIK